MNNNTHKWVVFHRAERVDLEAEAVYLLFARLSHHAERVGCLLQNEQLFRRSRDVRAGRVRALASLRRAHVCCRLALNTAAAHVGRWRHGAALTARRPSARSALFAARRPTARFAAWRPTARFAARVSSRHVLRHARQVSVVGLRAAPDAFPAATDGRLGDTAGPRLAVRPDRTATVARHRSIGPEQGTNAPGCRINTSLRQATCARL